MLGRIIQNGKGGGEKRKGKMGWVLTEVYSRRPSGLDDKFIYSFKLMANMLGSEVEKFMY